MLLFRLAGCDSGGQVVSPGLIDTPMFGQKGCVCVRVRVCVSVRVSTSARPCSGQKGCGCVRVRACCVRVSKSAGHVWPEWVRVCAYVRVCVRACMRFFNISRPDRVRVDVCVAACVCACFNIISTPMVCLSSRTTRSVRTSRSSVYRVGLCTRVSLRIGCVACV